MSDQQEPEQKRKHSKFTPYHDENSSRNPICDFAKSFSSLYLPVKADDAPYVYRNGRIWSEFQTLYPSKNQIVGRTSWLQRLQKTHMECHCSSLSHHRQNECDQSDQDHRQNACGHSEHHVTDPMQPVHTPAPPRCKSPVSRRTWPSRSRQGKSFIP